VDSIKRLETLNRGGPPGLAGTWTAAGIQWEDGNAWAFASVPPFGISNQNLASTEIGGLFKDPNHFKFGSFAGTRMISDEVGDEPGTDLFIVGSDDGDAFWYLEGEFTNKGRGELTVNFAPKGGPSNLTGIYNGTAIVWEDGNAWPKAGAY